MQLQLQCKQSIVGAGICVINNIIPDYPIIQSETYTVKFTIPHNYASTEI